MMMYSAVRSAREGMGYYQSKLLSLINKQIFICKLDFIMYGIFAGLILSGVIHAPPWAIGTWFAIIAGGALLVKMMYEQMRKEVE